jgi:hypothetical protein
VAGRQRFQPAHHGPAEAYAVVVVHCTDGTSYEFHWYDDVQLR